MGCNLLLCAIYHIMILVYFTVGSTSSGSAFVIAPKLGAKTIFESISLWRQLLPLYFLIRFFNQISHASVLFKDVTFTWINSDSVQTTHLVIINKLGCWTLTQVEIFVSVKQSSLFHTMINYSTKYFLQVAQKLKNLRCRNECRFCP
jgi:hypothetical protein